MTFPEGEDRLWIDARSWCKKCGFRIILVSDHSIEDGREDSPEWLHEVSMRSKCNLPQPVADPGHNETEPVKRYEDVIW